MAALNNIDIFKAERVMPNNTQLVELRKLVNSFLKSKLIVPPLSQSKLSNLTIDFIKNHTEFSAFVKLIAILVNNFAWEKVVSSIPYNRRVLLLPKCMQNSKMCTAKTDELGLLCELCGGCKLTDYITTAETLGYNVIVSEGSGAVSVLLNSGQIECVVGVACLESFERTFPISLKQAIPSIAIPLFNADCKDSRTDESWLNNTLKLNSIDPFLKKQPLPELRNTVNSWFSDDYLQKLFIEQDESSAIANKWLQAGGKRWRPLIMLALNNILDEQKTTNPEGIAKLGIAIESFHKASLAHDDIVDNDFERYGEESLLNKHGLAITLNTGDLLLSYGYQLIANSGFSALHIQKLIACVAKAHRELCLGQGEELLWQQKNKMPGVEKVIEIFANKTAPAFDVSLQFAATVCNSDDNTKAMFKEFSKNIGIAYQIKDDLDDFNSEQQSNDIIGIRPSIVLAILNKKDSKEFNQLLIESPEIKTKKIINWAVESGAVREAKLMLEEYKNHSLKAIDNLENISAKILLYQLLNKIVG